MAEKHILQNHFEINRDPELELEQYRLERRLLRKHKAVSGNHIEAFYCQASFRGWNGYYFPNMACILVC